MRHKYLPLALFASLSFGVAMAAPQQDAAPAPQNDTQAEHRPMDPNRQLQFLTKKLNLTSDQQSQILPILTDRVQQMQALRGDTSLAEKDRHQKMRSLHEESQSKIEAILTAEQKQTFEQMHQHSHVRRGTGDRS